MSNRVYNGALAFATVVANIYAGWNFFISPIFGMKVISIVQAIYGVMLLTAFWTPYAYMKSHRIFGGEPQTVYCRQEDEWSRFK